MYTSAIGILVKDENNNILFYENNFFVKEYISKEDNVKVLIEDVIEKIIGKKTFKVEKISKKMPRLSMYHANSSHEEYITMYLVKVITYDLNSNFMSKEDILDSIPTSLYKDYFIKYIIRYDKYNSLVNGYIRALLSFLALSVILDMPFKISINIPFDSFWISMLVYVVIPVFILQKFIIPSIVNHLSNYHINEKVFKISHYLDWIFLAIYILLFLKYT